MYRWIKLSNEAQKVALSLARRGYQGRPGDPLPCMLDSKTVEEINKNQNWFKLAVHMHKLTALESCGTSDQRD